MAGSWGACANLGFALEFRCAKLLRIQVGSLGLGALGPPLARAASLTGPLGAAVGRFGGALRDLAPIIAVIAFFQIVVLQQPFPDLGRVLVGLVCVVAGLAMFIQGLELGLFPLGEAMARAFARKGSLVALFAFAFFLGFGTTVAEPALIAIAAEAANVAAEGGGNRRR